MRKTTDLRRLAPLPAGSVPFFRRIRYCAHHRDGHHNHAVACTSVNKSTYFRHISSKHATHSTRSQLAYLYTTAQQAKPERLKAVSDIQHRGSGTGGHCKSVHAAHARTSSVPRTSFHVSSGVDLSRLVCCVVMARTSARGCRRGSAGAVARLKKVCRVLRLAATCSAELTIFNFRGAREAQ